MNSGLKCVALTFITIFALGVWFLVGSYVGRWLPFSRGGGINWWWLLSGLAGSVAAASAAAPFLVVLFERRRWLAALFVGLPVFVVVIDPTYLFIEGAFLALSYFALLMMGVWLSARVLDAA